MEKNIVKKLIEELAETTKLSAKQLGKYGGLNSLSWEDLLNLSEAEVERKIRKTARETVVKKAIAEEQQPHVKEFLEHNKKQLIECELTTTRILWEQYEVVYKELKEQGESTDYDNIINNLSIFEKPKRATKPQPEAEQKTTPEQPKEQQKKEDPELSKAKERYDKAVAMFENLLECTQQVYIYGPAGTGKTTIARKYAEKLGLKVYGYCSGCDSYQFKGFEDVAGNYQYSLVEKWFKNGGMLILDELDNYQASVLVELNDYLNRGTTKITLSNGEELTRHKDTYVVATGNTDGLGATMEYHSRDRLDASVLSRLGRFKFDEMEYIIRLILGDKYESIKQLHWNCNSNGLNIRSAEKYKSIVDKMGMEGLTQLIKEYSFRV